MPNLNKKDRNTAIYQMSVGGATQKEIGKQFGISSQFVSQIVRKIESDLTRSSDTVTYWNFGLSFRVCNVLENMGIKSREEAMSAVKKGQLKLNSKVRNYGKKSHFELLKWLGLSAASETGPYKVFYGRFCPHCEKELWPH